VAIITADRWMTGTNPAGQLPRERSAHGCMNGLFYNSGVDE
jgi:hypothetical protein